jgi:hypothetical protein
VRTVVERKPDPPKEPRAKYPWRSLEVGDAFLVEGVPANTVRAAATSFSKRHAMRFTVRMVEGGVRVWRIA